MRSDATAREISHQRTRPTSLWVGRVSGIEAALDNIFAVARPENQRDNEHYQENEEQDLGGDHCSPFDATESKQSRNDCDNQE